MKQLNEAGPISPREFFDELVPRLLKAAPEQRPAARGTCQISLFGEERHSWTIDLGLRTVQSDPIADPDVHLELDDADFRAMLLDRLDWEEAVIAGRVRCCGQLSVLADLATILEPHSAAL